MQMVPSVGPSLCLNPLMLPRALPSRSPLQHGSPAIDLLRVPTTWIIHSALHVLKADVWQNSIHQQQKKDHLLRLAHTSRFVVERCCLAAWEPALKLLLGYKLTYTSTIRLSETIMKDSSG